MKIILGQNHVTKSNYRMFITVVNIYSEIVWNVNELEGHI